jgi:hypothetical protein
MVGWEKLAWKEYFGELVYYCTWASRAPLD